MATRILCVTHPDRPVHFRQLKERLVLEPSDRQVSKGLAASSECQANQFVESEPDWIDQLLAREESIGGGVNGDAAKHDEATKTQRFR